MIVDDISILGLFNVENVEVLFLPLDYTYLIFQPKFFKPIFFEGHPNP